MRLMCAVAGVQGGGTEGEGEGEAEREVGSSPWSLGRGGLFKRAPLPIGGPFPPSKPSLTHP